MEQNVTLDTLEQIVTRLPCIPSTQLALPAHAGVVPRATSYLQLSDALTLSIYTLPDRCVLRVNQQQRMLKLAQQAYAQEWSLTLP
jgi:hypothetical protein